MKKITTLALIGLLSVNLMACGNVKDKAKGTESTKNEKVESISDKNIINGCDDYLDISGKALLDLKQKDKVVSISEKTDLEIIMKRGNPNGMNIRILNKKGEVLTDLMNGDEIDEKITDEFGMPRKNIDYEVGLYDLDRDNINEIIFSARIKNEILGYVYRVKEEKDNIKIQFATKFKKSGQKTMNVADKTLEISNITTKAENKRAKNFWQDKNKFDVEMLYAMDETFLKSKGVATIKKEKSLDSGTIFSVVVNSDDNNIKNRTMSYFYVEDEKIYVLYNFNKDKNVNKDSMQIAFQSNKLKEDDGKGLRYQITPKGNKTNFYLRTYNVETYFFNRIVWGKYRNIKSYKSGYGAGRDLLQVKFIF